MDFSKAFFHKARGKSAHQQAVQFQKTKLNEKSLPVLENFLTKSNQKTAYDSSYAVYSNKKVQACLLEPEGKCCHIEESD